MELINVGNNLVILNVIRSSLFGLIFSVPPHYYNSHNKEANISLDQYKLKFFTLNIYQYNENDWSNECPYKSSFITQPATIVYHNTTNILTLTQPVLHYCNTSND